MTSKSTTSDRSNTASKAPQDAYLVVHHGVRWTDVIRLAGETRWTIGRSSSNPIVLRTSLASRQHAEIRPAETPEGPVWAIADLNSRNGVRVNDHAIRSPTILREMDRIRIAGFEMTFTRNPASLTQPAHATRSSLAAGSDEGLTQDHLGWDSVDQNGSAGPDDGSAGSSLPGRTNSAQQTTDHSEIDIVGRLTTSGMDRRSQTKDEAPGESTSTLLSLAFAMGRAESVDECGETLMQALEDALPHATLGLYLFDAGQKDSLLRGSGLAPPRFVRQPQGTRYRRPPHALVESMLRPGSSAVLARNILGDRRLATENTAGEIDVESIILAPLRDNKSVAKASTASKPENILQLSDLPTGMLHVTTPSGQPSLAPEQLRHVVAAGEIFCQAIRSIVQRSTLTQSLRQSEAIVSRLRRQLAGRIQILGNSEPIRTVQRQIAQVAPTPAVVLVRGESGVGKELVASAIHHASARRDGPLICLNCAALSKDLLESELFGHEQGAFTGATQQKRGKFEAASGGTLMLDEIGEMSLDLQAKLLRVLEGHPFERVGGHEPIRADVRVVAATHRDLKAMVEQNQFREDLFYRLNVVEIVVPSLRERGRDVVLLADHFLKTFAESMARGKLRFTPLAHKKLLRHRWPGNVRELRNVVERAVVMSPMDQHDDWVEIDADDLLIAASSGTNKKSSGKVGESAAADVELSLAELEMLHIQRVLKHTDGNKSRAATMLGIERSTLDRKLKRAGKMTSS
ncbi:sigma 54-interacting transcriptional regulator [Rhodopirellula sp. JC740]|uniref:Sigma 54-interacting transcriptional regulator n=1 Tax=Rhodopirellula halodulae TaxID=2894198 RepID=A0ABS8NNM8_9BACT|nr:sigma 54-interacting transcriptional regulator [Rhodopirellula sp. JC740]